LTGPLTLRITGDPRHLSTARSFVGSVARVLGVDDERRHDLRLAVSELATAAISSGSMELSLTVDIDGDVPVLRLATDGTAPPPVPAHTSELLGAIFDDSVWSSADPWVIRLVSDGSS
jgi:hypothetical protein